MSSLRERCAAFLEKRPPKSLGYVTDSIAERVLRLAAAGEAIDGEMRELLELCLMETQTSAAGFEGEARAYLLEGAELLEEISETT
jgi:hypothetical protein